MTMIKTFCLGLVFTATTSVALAQDGADFSGIWMPDRTPGYGVKPFPRANWPYTERGQALQDAFQAEFDPDADDPTFFCVQPGLPMSLSPAAPFPLEVIQRDQDVTMFFEAWSQYRKIYMEDHPYPEPLLNSRMGFSTGHWEGDELVVKTTHLTESTMGRSLMSDQASFTERLHVETGEDGLRRLIVDIVFTDPVMYRESIPVRGVWIEAPDIAILNYDCADAIYADYIERKRAARP